MRLLSPLAEALTAARLRRLLRAAFVPFLLLPTAQMVAPVVTEWKLAGVESPPPAPEWTWHAWRDGSLAAALDLGIRRGIGFRATSVRLVNQAKLAWGNDSLGHQEVFIGKDHWLFARSYLEPYRNPARRLTDEELRDFAGSLRRLQDRLAQRGTAFVFVISPSKCELYPEHMPDAYVADRRRADCRRDYDVFLQLLAEQGVNVVDGPRILERHKARGVDQLFSRTGVHWSYHGCLLVWREILAAVNTAAGIALPVPEIIGLAHDRARSADNDLGELINVFLPPGGTPRVPYPLLEVDPLPAHRRPNFLFVGSSFSWTLMDSLYASGSGREVDIFYYNQTHYRGPDGDGLRRPGEWFSHQQVCSLADGAPDWRRTLLDKDVVVMEMLEFLPRSRVWEFCEPAIAALEQDADVPARGPPLGRLAGSVGGHPRAR